MPSITLAGTKSKQYGPITIPAIIYAVTLGNFNSLVIRVKRKPNSNIRVTDIMTTDTYESAPTFSYNSFNNFIF